MAPEGTLAPELQALLDALPEPCLLVASDGTVRAANRRALQAVRRDAADVAGQPLAALAAPDTPPLGDYLRCCLRSGGPTLGALTLVAGDGAAQAFRVEGLRFAAPGAPLALLRLVPRDAATARFLALNQQLERLTQEVRRRQRAEEVLAEANNRKDQFLAMLSHELRNPLGPLRNGVHLLRLIGAPAGKATATLEIMERQVAHISRLVDDLMDASRLTRGKIRLRLADIELHEPLEHAVTMLRPRLEARGQSLSVSAPPGIAIHADPARLVQVASNLLDNASKFTPEGGHIAVAAAVEAGEAVLRVRDNGCGIPAETLPRIFEFFTQGDRGADPALGGLGIGLAVVKSLVELHGGRVSAHSAGAGQGTEMVLHLPLALPSQPQAAPASSAAATA